MNPENMRPIAMYPAAGWRFAVVRKDGQIDIRDIVGWALFEFYRHRDGHIFDEGVRERILHPVYFDNQHRLVQEIEQMEPRILFLGLYGPSMSDADIRELLQSTSPDHDDMTRGLHDPGIPGSDLHPC